MRSPLIVLSLVTNLALGGYVAFTQFSKSGAEASTPTSGATAQAPAPKSEDQSQRLAERRAFELLESLGREDSTALIPLVRGLNLPKDKQDELLAAFMFMRFIRLEMMGSQRRDQPYWKSEGMNAFNDPKRREERRQRQKEMMAFMREAGLAGSMMNMFGGRSDARYRGLSEEKRQQLALIEMDYEEMQMEAREATSEFSLKSDRERMKLLQEEKKKDIAALLGPEEQAKLELLSSPVTDRVRMRYGAVFESEEEFLAVHALYKDFDKNHGAGEGPGNVSKEGRAAAEKALQAQVATLLGEERMRQLALLNDPETRLLDAASKRLNLPASTQGTVLALRESIAQESAQIQGNANLSAEQKLAAQQALGEQARNQLRSVFGEEGLEAYAQRSQWLNNLKQGNGYKMNPEGGITVERNAPPKR